MTKEQAIVQFLHDLRDNRELQHKLFTLAKEQPDAVIDYIATLPTNWQTQDNATTDLLIRLERIARKQIER